VSSALKNIKLSKEQEAKVGTIRKSFADKTKEHRQKFLEDQKKLRERMLNDVKGVLTPEQQKEFDEAIKKGPGRVGPGKSTSFPRLDLSIRARRNTGAD
jgi:Spy/CpxP family protein refolding chaperone